MFLIWLVHSIFQIFYFLIIVRVIVSWVRPNVRDKRIIKALRLLYDVTEPVLAPVRNVIYQFSSSQMRIDFSPFIVIILLPFVERIILSILRIFI